MKMSGKYINYPENECGFSLIEILILIVVVGIAASAAMQWLSGSLDDVRKAKTEREMEMLAKAIVGNQEIISDGRRADFGYIGDVGAFPPSLQALYQISGGYATWDGPYITPEITQDNTGFRYDEWGVAYVYSGGITITSTGSGSTIIKKIADAGSDYLLNSFNGQIRDASGNRPGTEFADSIDIIITIPDGSGGIFSKNYHPDFYGTFSLDSLPVGNHPLRIIYTPAIDTLFRYLTILPRHKSGKIYKFASDYFAAGTSLDTSHMIISTAGSAALGGLGFADEDLVDYDSVSGDASMYLVGSTVFSGNVDIDAVHILANNHTVLSTTGPASIDGLSFQDEDLVDYDPVAGTAVMLLDGSTIFSGDEDIDAVYVTDSGSIMLSTADAATIGGLSFQDEDIVEYQPSTGTASVIFDGSVAFSNGADVNGLYVLSNGHLILSVDSDSRQLDGLTFNAEDLVEYDPVSGTATMFFDGQVPFGTGNENIDAVHIGKGVGSVAGGSGVSIILRPDGNGSLIDLTNSGCSDNFQCVDEGSGDGDATRVIRASNSYATDVYSIEDPADTSGSVVGVTVYCRTRRTQSQGSVMPVVYSNSTAYNGTQQNLTGSYANYNQEWPTNPGTGLPWTWTDIINLQAGVRLRGQNFNFPGYCTQVWVEVAIN